MASSTPLTSVASARGHLPGAAPVDVAAGRRDRHLAAGQAGIRLPLVVHAGESHRQVVTITRLERAEQPGGEGGPDRRAGRSPPGAGRPWHARGGPGPARKTTPPSGWSAPVPAPGRS